MINFQLRCHDEHFFEAWFFDSHAFDNQSQVGLVECPYCGSTKISKARDAPKKTFIKPSVEPRNVPQNDGELQTRARKVAQQILDTAAKLTGHAEVKFNSIDPGPIKNQGRDKTASTGDPSDEKVASTDDEIIDIEGLPSRRSRTND